MSEKLAPSRPDQPNHDRVALSEDENALFDQIAENYDGDSANEVNYSPEENIQDAPSDNQEAIQTEANPYEVGAEVPIVDLEDLAKARNSNHPEKFIKSGWKISEVHPKTDKNGEDTFTLEKPTYFIDENGEEQEGSPRLMKDVSLSQVIAWRNDANDLRSKSEKVAEQARPVDQPQRNETVQAVQEQAKEVTYEIGQEVAVRRNVYKDGNVDFSQSGPLESGWVVESVAPDGSYVVGKEGGLTHDGKPGHLRKVVDANTLKNWSENQLEDDAYAENARRDGGPNRMNPNQPSLDSMERVSGPESVDFNTRIGTQANRVADWLGDKAEKYENAGGIKGMARKALRRLGSAAYRKSGLKATVESVKSGIDKTKDFASRTAEAAGNAKDRTLDSMSDFAGRIEDAAYRPIDYLRQKRDEALKRAAIRARERAAQKARHEQIKREQAQTRREKEVLDYVASQETNDENESSIDLAEEVKKRRGETRGKHRKANERTERRRKAMRALREQLGETSREMWDTSRTKQLGGAIARYTRKAKNVAKGAATGAIDGARAGARL